MEREARDEKKVKRFPEREKSILEMHSREEAVAALNKLYEKGYRYAVRDRDMPYIICYSLKPKRYRDIESWGYVDPDEEGALMAYPFKNIDVTEINYSNRSATLIKDFLSEENEQAAERGMRSGEAVCLHFNDGDK